MSRKKNRPLPPRTLGTNRAGRLQSAGPWLALQYGRPPARIAKSYRQRFGVDWPSAISELTALGIVFDVKWREQLARTLEGGQLANARRRAERSGVAAGVDGVESDENFAFIAGYTEGGAPFGVTWEECEKSPPGPSPDPSPDGAHKKSRDAEDWPF